MSKFVDIAGKKYNHLTVIKRLENAKGGVPVWECKCDCGNITTVRGSNLKNGSVKSCGCLRHKPTVVSHNMSNTRLYHVYAGMKSRCFNKSLKTYKNYGGRGITICDEWKNNFINFYNWAMENGYKEGLTIERIDNDGNYEPKNCKWIPKSEQPNNRRMNYKFTYDGKTQNLAEWCKELGLDYKRTHSRIYKQKWDFEKAITTPCDVSKRNKKVRGNKNV